MIVVFVVGAAIIAGFFLWATGIPSAVIRSIFGGGQSE